MTASLVTERLWVGGFDDVVLWWPARPPNAKMMPATVSCCGRGGTYQFNFLDDAAGMSTAERDLALKAASLTARLVREKRETLVFCKDGRNRACLIAALALIELGYERTRALAHVRAARGPALPNGYPITNPYFERFVITGSPSP